MMKSKAAFSAALAAIFLCGPGLTQARAAQHIIRLTTLAPEGSSFHKSLQRMGQSWRKVSRGSVDLILFARGSQGGEEAMVQRMRINQSQAGLLTTVGLSEIVPEVAGLQSIPMLFRSLEEVDYIGTRLKPRLEKLLLDKGFVVLFWTDAGWVRFFSKSAAVTPDEMRQQKLFAWAGYPETIEILRAAKFQAVPLETSDIYTGLQTGLISAVAMPPLAANYGLIYNVAPHMLELNWAPLVGAAVITKRAWDRIPPAIQSELAKVAGEIGQEITASGRRENQEAVEIMQSKWNLQVHAVSPEIEEQWRKGAEAVYPLIRGKMVPLEIFDEVQALLKEHRKTGGEQ